MSSKTHLGHFVCFLCIIFTFIILIIPTMAFALPAVESPLTPVNVPHENVAPEQLMVESGVTFMQCS